MSKRVYIVTVENPDGEDEFNYEVRITRHGEKICDTLIAAAVPVSASIGAMIIEDVQRGE